MKVLTRREFLKFSGVTAAGLAFSQLGFDRTAMAFRMAPSERRRRQRQLAYSDYWRSEHDDP